MSSNILTRAIDWNVHDVVYAGAQKNCGPSGVTLVIARKDLITNKDLKLAYTPSMCDWELALNNESMLNTPPTYPIYMLGLYADYLKRQGGVAGADQLST